MTLISTLGDILAGRSAGAQAKNCVYLLRDETTWLYVGKTVQSTVHKRFLAHLGQGPAFMQKSRLGLHIEEQEPACKTWLVEVLNRDDWNALFDAARLPRRFQLNTAESALIRLYRPSLNRQSHPDHARPLPWAKAES